MFSGPPYTVDDYVAFCVRHCDFDIYDFFTKMAKFVSESAPNGDHEGLQNFVVDFLQIYDKHKIDDYVERKTNQTKSNGFS